MHRCQKASHLPRRAAGPLAVAATLAATARPPTMSGQAGAPASPVVEKVAAGAARSLGEQCITNGSVAIASVGADGRLGATRLVSDQRGTGSFDDRPMVAAGQHGTVWVAWSQGPDADACQNVGNDDRIEVAVSLDGGRTFGVPVAMPADGGHAARAAARRSAGGLLDRDDGERRPGRSSSRSSAPTGTHSGRPWRWPETGRRWSCRAPASTTSRPGHRRRRRREADGRRAFLGVGPERDQGGRRPSGRAAAGDGPGSARRRGSAAARARGAVAGRGAAGVRRPYPDRRQAWVRLGPLPSWREPQKEPKTSS